MIAPGDWRQMIRECSPDDLTCWHADWRDIDWSASLAQPHWHLITDNQGSWCLMTPVDGSSYHLEAHLIIAAEHRGKAGLTIARTMLTWIADNLAVHRLYAEAIDRKATLFLRWLGFHYIDGYPRLLKWTAIQTAAR